MNKVVVFFAVLVLVFVAGLRAAPPVVSNVRVAQRGGTKLMDITYDLAYSGGGTMTVWVNISADGGRSYIVPAKTFSGAIGSGITAGVNKVIVWDAAADFDGALVDKTRVRITALAGTVPIPPPRMVFIPGGSFQMGDGDLGIGARTVYISPMFMDRYEVTGALYSEVQTLAANNGYSMGGGSWRGPDHPVQSITWYDAVKWCNARSQKDGLTPVYYTDTAKTTIYKTGNVDLTNAMVKWDADGYRLPTESEWEKAARGGLTGKQYPWGDTIDGSKANYNGSGDPYETGSPGTSPVGYYNGSQTPAGVDMANGYGLYDMAGNVWEWCWDRYSSQPTGESNPQGPDTGGNRLLRGGSWYYGASNLCAYRYYNYPSNDGSSFFGFRCVRGL